MANTNGVPYCCEQKSSWFTDRNLVSVCTYIAHAVEDFQMVGKNSLKNVLKSRKVKEEEINTWFHTFYSSLTF